MTPQIKKTCEDTPGPGTYDIVEKKKITKGIHNLFGSSDKNSIYKIESVNNPAPN